MESQFIWECGRKSRYRTEGKARQYAHKVAGERGVVLKTYQCRFCLGWHLAKLKPEGKRMKLYIKGGRLSYTQQLFEKKQVNGQGKEKYSCATILEPSTKGFVGDANPDSTVGKAKGYRWTDFKTAFSQAIMGAAEQKWGAKAGDVVNQLKANNKLCLHSGEEKGETPGYKGNFFVNASNEVRPQVRSRNGGQLEASDGVIYSGCYADVILDIWAQDNQFGKRVNASLLGVTFSHDGERLAGGSTVTADDYEAIPEGAAATAASSGGGAAALF